MNNSQLPKFIGVLVSFFLIWLIIEYTLVGSCEKQGGIFEYRTGQCVLENGEIFKSGLETPMVFLYIFIGFAVTLSVSRLLTKKENKSE